MATFNKIDNSLETRKIGGHYIRLALWRLWINKKKGLKEKESFEERDLKRKLMALRQVGRGGGLIEEVSTRM